MITLSDIVKAINVKLRSTLPDIPIQSQDIKEGFSRPSLFVDIENVQSRKYGPDGLERTVSLTIYYYPKDKVNNKIELLNTQDALEKAFTENLVIRQGFVVFPEDITSIKVDGVLQTSFDIKMVEYELEEEADGENIFMMGQLNMENKVN